MQLGDRFNDEENPKFIRINSNTWRITLKLYAKLLQTKTTTKTVPVALRLKTEKRTTR